MGLMPAIKKDRTPSSDNTEQTDSSHFCQISLQNKHIAAYPYQKVVYFKFIY